MKFSAYPPLDGLVDLACRDGVDIRPTLLRVLTDLYVQKPTHSADEETQYVELALGLIEGLTKVFYPEASAVVIFVIMALVLLVRPAGLFGRET